MLDTFLPIQSYSSDLQSETCAVCLEDFKQGDQVRMLACRHLFHYYCIDKWLTTRKSTCPTCKSNSIAIDRSCTTTSETQPLLTSNARNYGSVNIYAQSLP